MSLYGPTITPYYSQLATCASCGITQSQHNSMQPEGKKRKERKKKIQIIVKNPGKISVGLASKRLVSGTLHVANIAPLRMVSGWV